MESKRIRKGGEHFSVIFFFSFATPKDQNPKNKIALVSDYQMTGQRNFLSLIKSSSRHFLQKITSIQNYHSLGKHSPTKTCILYSTPQELQSMIELKQIIKKTKTKTQLFGICIDIPEKDDVFSKLMLMLRRSHPSLGKLHRAE